MRERTKDEVLGYLRSIGCRPEVDSLGKETGRYTIPRNSRIGLRYLGAVNHFGIQIASQDDKGG